MRRKSKISNKHCRSFHEYPHSFDLRRQRLSYRPTTRCSYPNSLVVTQPFRGTPPDPLWRHTIGRRHSMLARLRAALPLVALALTLFLAATPLVEGIPPYNLQSVHRFPSASAAQS